MSVPYRCRFATISDATVSRDTGDAGVTGLHIQLAQCRATAATHACTPFAPRAAGWTASVPSPGPAVHSVCLVGRKRCHFIIP